MNNEIVRYYTDEWCGNVTDPEELGRLIFRAVDVVDTEIYLSGYAVDTVPEYMQTAVYKAVCAQVDFIDGLGGVEAMSDDNTMTSVTLGRYSYSGGNSENGAGGGSSASSLCSLARKYLIPTGLLYKGVNAV